MTYYLSERLKNLLSKNSSRSKQIIKNILLSFGLKGGGIFISLLLVPLTINYVSPIEYGIWLTISSLVSWLSFFDVGLGNGLRNLLTKSISLHEYNKAKIYISTTYAVLIIITLIITFLFLITNQLVNWRLFLNIPRSVQSNIENVILIVFASFCIQFVVQTINTILIAHHESAKVGMITFLGQALVLATIVIAKKFTPGSLQLLVSLLTAGPLIILSLASIILFKTKFKNIAPSLKFVKFDESRNLFGTGSIFFIIQIGALALFQTSNIIITKVIGPEAVTQYNVAYKLFSIIPIVFTIIMTPYWSAFTDAYVKGDYSWMKKNVDFVRRIWAVSSFVIVPILFFTSPYLFKMWLGNSVIIPNMLTATMSVYIISHTGLTLSCYFLNGIGKLRIQLYLYIASCILNVPLGIFLSRSLGVSGVVVANAIVMTVMCFILWIQCDKILNQKASGIWTR